MVSDAETPVGFQAEDAPVELLRGLSDAPFVTLADAINYLLLGGTALPVHRSERQVFVQDPALALPDAILSDPQPDLEEIRRDMDQRMSRGLATGELKFFRTKVALGEGRPETGQRLRRVPKTYGAKTRGLDEEGCRITAVSLFASDEEISEWQEETLENPIGTIERVNVVIESTSFFEWAKREYPSVVMGRSLKWASRTTLHALIREEFSRHGTSLTQRKVEQVLDNKGFRYNRDDFRGVYNDVTGHAKRGPRGPRTGR